MEMTIKNKDETSRFNNLLNNSSNHKSSYYSRNFTTFSTHNKYTRDANNPSSSV